MSKIYIIGCGGVGSWLAPCLIRLAPDGKRLVTLVDGDTLEPKNMDRQLFDESDIGDNKAHALSRRYHCEFIDKWYSLGTVEHTPSDWLFVCVDNHPARLAALRACDMFGCSAIVGCNETTSAEAYIYRPEWRDTRLDPRVYYPEISSDRSGDPRAAAIGCTGESQLAKPQLVTANKMASSLMEWLFVAWAIELPKSDDQSELIPHLPHKLVANMTKTETFKTGTP